MGKYYDVQQVKEQGVLLRVDNASKQPTFNGRLTVILDNGIRKVAPDVTDPAEYQYFYQKYLTGSWLTFDVYELPADFGEEKIPAAPSVWNYNQIGFSAKRPKRRAGNTIR